MRPPSDAATPPDADAIARDLADVAAATGLTLYTGRTPDDDGLVWCCETLGRVTPEVAHAHAMDDPPYDYPYPDLLPGTFPFPDDPPDAPRACECGRPAPPGYAKPIPEQATLTSYTAARAVQMILNGLVYRRSVSRVRPRPSRTRALAVLAEAGYVDGNGRRQRTPDALCRRCYLKHSRALYADVKRQRQSRSASPEAERRRV